MPPIVDVGIPVSLKVGQTTAMVTPSVIVIAEEKIGSSKHVPNRR